MYSIKQNTFLMPANTESLNQGGCWITPIARTAEKKVAHMTTARIAAFLLAA